MLGITKRFPTVVANDDVDFRLCKGEIHGLLGENGAGKTTLMNVLYGLLQPDGGTIYVRGKKARISSPKDAIRLGMGMVRQHFTLIPRLTVAENIAIGFRNFSGASGRRRLQETAEKIAQNYNLTIPLDSMVETLAVGEKQRAEIVRALCRGAEIMILDEPTAVLTPQEVDGLFGALRILSRDNKSTIFITHKVREALTICNRVTVMSKGRVMKTLPSKEISELELSRMMIGSAELEGISPGEAKATAHVEETLLEMNNVSATADDGRQALRQLSLELHRGEILGIAGVSGNGQSELLEVAAGLRRPTSGEVRVFGKPPKKWSREHFIRLGISYIPEDRMNAVLPGLPLWRTAVLGSQFTYPNENRGMLNILHIKRMAQQMISDYGIAARSPDVNVQQLSGGNLQRLVLARELSRSPKIILAAQPTRGLDIAATERVHNALREKRLEGSAILLVSENLDEIFALSDRISVIYDGRIVGTFGIASAKVKEIGALMLGMLDQNRSMNPEQMPPTSKE